MSFYSSPIKQYEFGRNYLAKSKKEIKKIYNLNNFYLDITYSSSQLSSLLALSLCNKKTYNLFTTKNEHYGGIMPFEKNENYKINYFDHNTLLRKVLPRNIKPDILFISHVFYKTGEIIPINKIISTILIMLSSLNGI